MGRHSAALEGVGVGVPPEARHGKYNWDVIADRTRAAAPEWFQVFEHDRNTLATQIRNGDVKALTPDKGFVVTTRHNKTVVIDGKSRRYCSLWLQYVPENDRSND